MDLWIEHRCEALRLALSITGFPTEADLYRLLDLLGANVTVTQTAGRAPHCLHRDGRGALLLLPRALHGREWDAALLHEIGHVLLTMGMGDLLRAAPPSRAIASLARSWDLQDEARAQRFLLAWLLPSAAVAAWREGEWSLSEQTGVRSELIRARRRQLGRTVVTLTEPPAWSAWHTYHVVAQACPVRPLLFAARRQSLQPEYLFPVTAPELEGAARQLSSELIALTAAEWAIKYAGFRAAPPRLVTVPLAVLLGAEA